MYPASAPPRPGFLRSQSLPSCCSGQMMPGHCDAMHQGMTEMEAEGLAASFDGADETPLLPTMPVPTPRSPINVVPRIYVLTPRQLIQCAPEMTGRMQGRASAATSSSPSSRSLEKRSRSSSDSSGSGSSCSGSAETTWHSATATATSAASASQVPKEKYVLRRALVGDQRVPSRRQGGPAGGRAKKTEAGLWHSYFAAGGTLIAFGCFAALAFWFVNESPPMFPDWLGGAERKARHHDGDNQHDPAKKDVESDLLAGSRNIVRYGTATNASSRAGRKEAATRRTYSRRRRRHHWRLNRTIPVPPLFPIVVPADTTPEARAATQPSSGAHRHSVQWDDKVCWTESCLAEGAALRSSLDTSVNPCDDFYAYACNRWSHERPLPRGQAVVSVDNDFMGVFTLDVFNMLGRGSDNKLFEKLRLLLEGCVAPSQDFFPRLAHEGLRSVALVGWPYDNDVDADAVSVSTTLGRMVVAYGFDPVFGLTLTVDPAAESGMRVAYAFFGPDPVLNEGIENGREYGFVRQAYDQLVEAVQEKSLYDPIETDVLLAAVFEETSSISTKALKLRNCSRKLVDELPYMGEWLFWDKVFAELGPNQGSDASNGSEVLLPDPALFERLGRTSLFKARGSKSKMANYLGFRLLLLLSPFGTGADDTNMPASLAYALHRNYPTSLHDYQACLRFVNRFEPVVAMHRLHGDWTSRLVKSNELIQLVTFLRAELSVCLQTSSLFFTTSTATVAKALLEFLRGLSWQVLNPDLVESTWTFEHLSAAYESLNVSNPKDIITFLHSVVQSKRDASSDLSAVQWKGGFLSTDATLAYPYKVLEVPLPVFNLQRALDDSVIHLQLARAGPRIYRAIYKALYYISSNLALENMTWNPLRYFDTAADCLWDQYSSTMRNDRAASSSNASSVSPPPLESRTRDVDDLFNALAVGSALDAYLFYVADKHKLYRFKGSEELDATQMFFVEYARNLCENRNAKFEGARSRGKASEVAGSRSPAWYKVNGPLMNMKEFAKSFSCRPGSFMNPVNKCPLIRKHH